MYAGMYWLRALLSCRYKVTKSRKHGAPASPTPGCCILLLCALVGGERGEILLVELKTVRNPAKKGAGRLLGDGVAMLALADLRVRMADDG